MKKHFVKLFNFFGFVPTEEYNSLQLLLEECQNELSEKNQFFDEPKKPSISSTEFDRLFGENKTGYTNWNLYWKEFFQNQYLAYYFITFRRHPDVLKEFFYQFSKFDWQRVESYMKEANWCWSNNKITPNVYDLQNCVFELFYTALKNEPENFIWSGGSTGGFELSINKIERQPNEIIQEKKYSVEIKFLNLK